MLLEFSVKNFKSIKEKQTLSLVSSKTHEESDFYIKTSSSSAPTVESVAGIYGPNSAGKSNVIQAMAVFRKIVKESFGSDEGDVDYQPYKLSKITRNEPTEFEIVFIYDGEKFQYGFTYDDSKIHEEWLFCTPLDSQKQKPQRWFERDASNIKKSYVRKELKGNKEGWLEATKAHYLFLSTAHKLNSKDFSRPYNWLLRYFRVLGTSLGGPMFTFSELQNPKKKPKILNFMQQFDVGFDGDLAIKEVKIEGDELAQFSKILSQEAIKEIFSSGKGSPTTLRLEIYHESDDGDIVVFEPEEESLGTRKLIEFAGPILDVLQNGYSLVVDEIQNNLHPHALKKLISAFNNKKINKKGAQLIFSSHDTNVLNYIQKGQIWFVDKKPKRGSVFYPLSDFTPSKDDAIERRYLAGRYGAVPNISEDD